MKLASNPLWMMSAAASWLLPLGSIFAAIHYFVYFAIVKYFGYGWRKFDTEESCILAMRSLNKDSIFYTRRADTANMFEGYFIGAAFFGQVTLSSGSYNKKSAEIDLYCSEEYFAEISTPPPQPVVIVKKPAKNQPIVHKISCVTRCSTDGKTVTARDRVLQYSVEPNQKQKDVISRIKNAYAKRQRCVVYLHGPSGSGKSSIGFMLATKMNAVLCRDFDPIRVGDRFEVAFSQCNWKTDGVVIMVIDEIDIALEHVIQENLPPAIDGAREVSSKRDWNRWMDNIDVGYYSRLILLFTSNVDPAEFDQRDPSLLREGRVHLRLKLD